MMSYELETNGPGIAAAVPDRDVPRPTFSTRERGGAGVSEGRRRSPRFEASANLIWMQWWEGGECLGRSARLVNVGSGGAMIVAAVRFRERQAVRIFLEGWGAEIGVAATVLGVVEGLYGLNQIRLGFETPCPESFIEAAACGFESWLAGERPRV